MTKEIKILAKWVHDRGMFLHMDGARVANAAVYLKKSIAEISTECGVDVLSFGGTKNGMMFGEVLVVMNEDVANNMIFFRKQGMQLPSKMRYVASQFDALLKGALWRKLAENANKMAALLENEVRDISGVQIVHSVQSNAVVAKIPAEKIKLLQKEFFFYVWDEDESIVRWMTHWQTEENDVRNFAKRIKEVMNS